MNFKKPFSPLSILFVLIILNSVWWFSKGSGPEGWGHFYAFVISLSSLPLIITDLIIRAVVKSRKRFFVLELIFALIFTAFLYEIKIIGNF